MFRYVNFMESLMSAFCPSFRLSVGALFLAFCGGRVATGGRGMAGGVALVRFSG
jgi:hypothetical protein